MKPFFATLLENVKGHPVAKALAIVGLGIWGGGYTLSEVPLEPWGTLVQGVGAAFGAAAMAVVALAKKKGPPQ